MMSKIREEQHYYDNNEDLHSAESVKVGRVYQHFTGTKYNVNSVSEWAGAGVQRSHANGYL